MTFAIELEHPTQVVRSPEPGHELRLYRAECDAPGCGWVSEWTTDQADAEDSRVDHWELTAHADDTDRFINELLDIQDGLAQLVVWLADNWSSDLPAPHWPFQRYSSDAVQVDVSVYCGHGLDVLRRVAELLGDSAERTEQCNQDGLAYWRCRRSFGRVVLEAWGLAP
jgi:hypothetical protein